MSCQSCTGCEHCTQCEGCYTCNVDCNKKCQACENSCDVKGCRTKQNFCSTNQSAEISFYDWNNAVTGKYIEDVVTFNNFNKLVQAVQDAWDAGEEWHRSGCPATKVSYNEEISAAALNNLARALWQLADSSSTYPSVSRGDFIYGTHFSRLQNQANILQYHKNQCDVCNTSCDVKCDKCNTCNMCDSEDTCNGQWCKQPGTQVCCDEPPPSSGGDSGSKT